MKFYVKESISDNEYNYEDEFKVIPDDLGYSDYDVLYYYFYDRYDSEEDNLKQLWIEKVYPELDEESTNTIENDYFGIENYLSKTIDYTDLMQDFADYEVFSKDEIQEMFEETFRDEIEDYLDDMEDNEEGQKQIERDYWRSRF